LDEALVSLPSQANATHVTHTYADTLLATDPSNDGADVVIIVKILILHIEGLLVARVNLRVLGKELTLDELAWL
jgi:hypothetical protein